MAAKLMVAIDTSGEVSDEKWCEFTKFLMTIPKEDIKALTTLLDDRE